MYLYACVLVTIETGQVSSVMEQIQAISDVGLAVITAGPFDLLIFVRGSSSEDIADIITEKIHVISGVNSTLSLVMLKNRIPLNWFVDGF